MAVILHLENLGDLKFELFIDEAPNACKNFLALAASDYYNGTKFHRNIKGFIILLSNNPKVIHILLKLLK